MHTELIAEIESLGLQSHQLDDIVHSEAEVRASVDLNEGEDPSDEASDDTYAFHASRASAMNNAGLDGQIEYLLETWTVTEVRQQVIELLS